MLSQDCLNVVATFLSTPLTKNYGSENTHQVHIVLELCSQRYCKKPKLKKPYVVYVERFETGQVMKKVRRMLRWREITFAQRKEFSWRLNYFRFIIREENERRTNYSKNVSGSDYFLSWAYGYRSVFSKINKFVIKMEWLDRGSRNRVLRLSGYHTDEIRMLSDICDTAVSLKDTFLTADKSVQMNKLQHIIGVAGTIVDYELL